MAESVAERIERLERELESAQKIIEALKKHQKLSRSRTIEGAGLFETMTRLEKIVERRTEQLERSRTKLQQAYDNLEMEVAARTIELERSNNELATLIEIGRQVSTTLDLNEILDKAINKLLQITGLRGGGFFLLDKEDNTLYSAGGWGFSQDFIDSTKKAVPGQGISGKVVESGNIMFIENLAESELVNPALKRFCREEGLKSQLSVPLRTKNEVIGVMNLVAAEEQIIKKEDIPLLEAVGNQIAMAVDNALLYKEARQRLSEIESLQRTAFLISSHLDLELLLNTIAEEAQKVFSADAVSIMLPDESGKYFKIGSARNLSDRYIISQLVPIGKADFALKSDKFEPVYFEDLKKTPFGDIDLLTEEDIYSCLSSPLIKDNVIFGILNIYSKAQVRRFNRYEVKLARTFADQATMAIDNAQRYEEEVRSKEEQRILYEIGQTIVSSLEMDKTLEFIISSIPRLVPCESAGILRLDELRGDLEVLNAYGFLKESLLKTRFKMEQGIVGIVAETGKAKLVRDTSKEPKYRTIFTVMGSEICVPLIHRSRVIGVVNIEHSEPNIYNERHLTLLQSLANLAAIALENARTFQESEMWVKHLQAISKLGNELNSILDVKALANKVVEELHNVIETDDCRFFILHIDTDELEPLAQKSTRNDHYQFDDISVLRLKLGEGITGNVAKIGVPELVSNTTKHPYAVTIPGTDDVFDESMILAPMIFENLVKGMITMSKVGLNQFTPDQLRLLSIFSDHAAIALENASLYQDKASQLAEIQRLKDFNEAIVEGLEEGIMIEAVDGRFAFVNPKMERITGYSFAELKKMHWTELYSREYHTVIADETAKIFLGRSSRYEAALINRQGEEVPVLISARPIHEKGQIVGILAAITDISELKQLQQKMERSARLRALGEMAGGVAHDFNNVLGAILGRAQLLSRQTDDPLLIEGLQVLEKAAEDGAVTVKRIQNFTRIRTSEKFEPVNLNELVEESLNITRVHWRENPDAQGIIINIKTNFGPIPVIPGNPSELREVFTNLIINAVDALPKGGNITISTSKNESNVDLTVEDDGVGIPEENKERIFDPFFSTKGIKGTGLGLSVSFGIVTRHDGEITVESELSKGSKFTVRFPIKDFSYTQEFDEPETTTVSRKLKAVVVDDDNMVRKLLSDILQIDGHTVLTAPSGQLGVQLIKEEKPDLVFTDLGMPNMSGWEVVKESKRISPETIVVMITGWGEQLDRSKLLKSKVDALIAKPFKVQQIRNTISRFYGDGKS
ncbi:GAF domain-containing protein [bacterium]|nr:GAF domain-containing protein [bacterium]